MNQHQQITAEMERQYQAMEAAILVGPSALAHAVFEKFSDGEEGAHIAYASLEHLKHMARVFLAKRKDPDADESDAYQLSLGTQFSGKLQDRYPLPRKSGEEPTYKLRTHLTTDEREWNVKQLRKSARARLEHADALEAEGQMRGAA